MSIDKEKVKAYLVKAFSLVLTEQDILTNRGRAFSMVINYKSPTSNVAVSEVLSNEEVGDVVQTILVNHTNARIEATFKKNKLEGGF